MLKADLTIRLAMPDIKSPGISTMRRYVESKK
jgi:hypothetical protein